MFEVQVGGLPFFRGDVGGDEGRLVELRGEEPEGEIVYVDDVIFE